MLEINKIHCGDCLELMKQIPDKSIDMVLCDLPYGTTACSWDIIIHFGELWKQYERIIKHKGAIVLTASQPFTSLLVTSNIRLFKYELIWVKTKFNSGFAHAKNKPLKKHENVLLFSKGVTNHTQLTNKRMSYYPQGLIKTSKKRRRNTTYTNVSFGKRPSFRDTTQEYTNYPQSILSFDLEIKKPLHPTQKPIELFKYLIKTYTQEGQLVLDNCIGSGTTAVACQQTGRCFIGIEKEQKYVDIANKRLAQKPLFEAVGNTYK